jgi:hypothetical protein
MADILIRGMEMPTEQRIEVLIFKNGFVSYYDVYGNYIGKAKATPLPKGHGDLIDRDALRAENGLNAKCEHCPTNTYNCQNDMIHTKMDFCEMLDDATVIVPAEGGGEDG